MISNTFAVTERSFSSINRTTPVRNLNLVMGGLVQAEHEVPLFVSLKYFAAKHYGTFTPWYFRCSSVLLCRSFLYISEPHCLL